MGGGSGRVRLFVGNRGSGSGQRFAGSGWVGSGPRKVTRGQLDLLSPACMNVAVFCFPRNSDFRLYNGKY